MKMIARQLSFRSLQAALLASLFTLSIAGSINAQSGQDNKFSTVKIKNFGQMDERFYRGAQPKPEDIKALAALGITTIIDLRDDPKEYEKREAEALGLHYVNIPMSDSRYPKQESIDEFLKLVNDSATGKFYVHCAGGRHRTGVMGAVYRYNLYGWNYDQVYKEMKDFDFYTRFGHGPMKDYVQDYWQQVQAGTIQTSAPAAGVTVSTSNR
jgi:protein tyrosine/serine phosphatase